MRHDLKLGEALHTAARRHCNSQRLVWHGRYGDIRDEIPCSDGYTAEEQFILDASHYYDRLLNEIEKRVGSDFHQAGDARSDILAAAEAALIEPEFETVSRAAGEQRAAWVEWLTALNPADFRDTVPLPFRRYLAGDELERLQQKVDRIWEIDRAGRGDVEAYQAAWFHHHIPQPLLREWLSELGGGRVFKLGEWGGSYEIDAEQALVFYGPFGELQCLTPDLSQIIYCSHESSITVGGEALLERVRQHWPGYKSHLYEDWDYEGPGYTCRGSVAHESMVFDIPDLWKASS